MTSSLPMASVGRALTRISNMRGRPETTSGDARGDSRSAILEYVEAARDVVRVEDISRATGLHVNTVRGHLEVLLAAGRITRIPDQRISRGRPHWLYTAASSASIRELSLGLDAALAGMPAPAVAREAAASWADAALGEGPVDSVDGAVDQAVEVLSGLGFDAVRNPVGDQISLRACPYATMVAEQPVICDIHAALLGEVLARSGQPVTLANLDVWPRPGVCVAHLNRPDTRPERTVRLPEQRPDRPLAPRQSRAGE